MSRGIKLNNIEVTDGFWKHYMELVRTEVIPYQWEALNDRVEDAPPSFAMRNFELAGKITKKRKEEGTDSVSVFPIDIFECLPESPDQMEERFYGFLFQDSDFSKWIEAVGYSLTQHPDERLEAIADGAIDIVCEAQQEDGYLDTFYIINDMSKRFTNLRDNHEMYCFGHLAEGAIAYYEATGKDKLLKAAERFAACIYERFGHEEGKCKGYPGHEIAEMALMRLYQVTENPKYLELAKFFIEERGTKPYYFDLEREAKPLKAGEERHQYNQAHRPVKEQDEAVGHAVRAVYLYSGMADLAKYAEDKELMEACELLWDNIVHKKMYITGGIGATHLGEAFSFNYDLPNDTAYAETCASIGLVFFAKRMLEANPRGEYADVMERALYNGILSGMEMDGKSFFYVNPLEVLPEACKKDERKKHVAIPRQKWFGCACCPPNIARLVSSIANYAYSENEDTLFMHLYIGGKLHKTFAGVDFNIEVTSSYPWDEDIKIAFETEVSTEFTYAVRIPGWCKDYSIRVNGECVDYKLDQGYAYISRKWNDKDTIDLHFPMMPQVYCANPKVREDIGKLSVMRGPVVYCLEEADNGTDLHLLRLGENTILNAQYEKDLLGGVMKITSTGKKLLTGQWDENTLYAEAGKSQYETINLTWIPYYVWGNRGVGEMQVWIRE